MASTFDCGCTEFIPTLNDSCDLDNNEFMHGHPFDYPFTLPKVYLEGSGEVYFPQIVFDWSDDSVVVARENSLIKYTQHCYCELLAEDEAGNVVWLDGRTAPYENCWKGKYLDEVRGALTYDIEEFHLDTLEKMRYTVTLDSTSPISADDLSRIKKYIDPAADLATDLATDPVAPPVATPAAEAPSTAPPTEKLAFDDFKF